MKAGSWRHWQKWNAATLSPKALSANSGCKGDGDLGQFPEGRMAGQFDDTIRSLEPGQRSGILTTPRPATALFEDVRADIERVMTMVSQHQV